MRSTERSTELTPKSCRSQSPVDKLREQHRCIFCDVCHLWVCDDFELYLALACEQFGRRVMPLVIQLTEEYCRMVLNAMGDLNEFNEGVNDFLRYIATIKKQDVQLQRQFQTQFL